MCISRNAFWRCRLGWANGKGCCGLRINSCKLLTLWGSQHAQHATWRQLARTALRS